MGTFCTKSVWEVPAQTLWISNPSFASHSITSSARVRSMGGTARPMAFAAFMLITSSSCVGKFDWQLKRRLLP